MEFFLYILFLIGVIFVIIRSTVSYKKEKKLQIDAVKKRISDNWKLDEKYLSEDDLSYLGISFDEQFVVLGKDDECKKYNFSQLLKVELLKDGSTISSVDGGRIGGALLGGILFGSVGAVVGAMGSSQSPSDHLISLVLRVIVEDNINPFWDIIFYKSVSHKGDYVALNEVKEAVLKADKFNIIIGNIIGR